MNSKLFSAFFAVAVLASSLQAAPSRPSFSRPSSSRPSSSRPSAPSASKPSAAKPSAAPAAKPAAAAKAPAASAAKAPPPAVKAAPPVAAKAPAARTTTTTTTTTVNRYRYNTRPTVWPMGLPSTYFYMGMMHSIMWDPIYRGYGWYGPSGRWQYYDEAAGGAVAGAQSAQPAVIVQPGFPWGAFFAWVFAGLIVLVICCLLFGSLGDPGFYDETDHTTVTTTTKTTHHTDA